MSELPRRSWLSFLLFWFTLALAASLFLLVILAPFLDNKDPSPRGWARWLALFARDVVLQRTALASAVCLAVTASVFFRPVARARTDDAEPSKPPRQPPPATMAGA